MKTKNNKNSRFFNDKETNLKKIEFQKNLIKNIQKNNCQKSMSRMIFEYINLIKATANSFKKIYSNTSLEFEDFENYFMMTFVELTKKYDISSPKSFPNYMKEFLSYSKVIYILEVLQIKILN